MLSPKGIIRPEPSAGRQVVCAESFAAGIIGLVLVVCAISGFLYARRSFAQYVEAHNVASTAIENGILSPGFVPPPSPEPYRHRSQLAICAIGMVCLVHVIVAMLRWHHPYILTLLICWSLLASAVASMTARV
jgi:hypothetical protein